MISCAPIEWAKRVCRAPGKTSDAVPSCSSRRSRCIAGWSTSASKGASSSIGPSTLSWMIVAIASSAP